MLKVFGKELVKTVGLGAVAARALGIGSISWPKQASAAYHDATPEFEAPYGVTKFQQIPDDAPFTTDPHFYSKTVPAPFPCFRLMDQDSKWLGEMATPPMDQALCMKVYKTMATLNEMDTVLQNSQRQGRISFYMTHFVEEAESICTAAALSEDDVIFPQYREAGALMWRGWDMQQFIDQCFNNVNESGKGRQMPIHYGDKSKNFQTVGSCLATQVSHAVGHAYAQKRMHDGKQGITVTYFGEGAASEGDALVSMNFAATVGAPVIFIVRNNAWAISTPALGQQYIGDGIACRGPPFRIPTIRVDGCDPFAVYKATKDARQISLETGGPTMIETMSYRGGNHSTSDDASVYRPKGEAEYWINKESPVFRMRNYLMNQGWWSEKEDEELRKSVKDDVLVNIQRSEKRPKTPIHQLFTDVYSNVPRHLQEQEKEMFEHVNKFPEHYALHEFAAEGHPVPYP